MDKVEIIRRMYALFQSRVYKSSKTTISDKEIENFLLALDKIYGIESVGLNFLYSYFSFQYEYWSKLDTERIPTKSWIIGKKAIERWLKKPENYSYFTLCFNKRYNLSIDYFIEHFNGCDLQPYYTDDMSRKTCKDPTLQLIHCDIIGLCYDAKSIICRICPYKKQCIENNKQI